MVFYNLFVDLFLFYFIILVCDKVQLIYSLI